MLSYTSLNREQSEIRLVRFAPESANTNREDTPIRLDLRHASVNDDKTQYTALSYVWGDQSDSRKIFINGYLARIGCNLHDALCHLRQMGVSSWLWIDAICIQQSNLEEKSWQVNLMRSVFSQAELVYAWLGPGTLATDVAMDFVRCIGQRGLSAGVTRLRSSPPKASEVARAIETRRRLRNARQGKPLNPEPQVSGPKDPEMREGGTKLEKLMADLYGEDNLYSRGDLHPRKPGEINLQAGIREIMVSDFWHRIWIIQEVALPRSVMLICGQKSMFIDQLDAALHTIDFCSRPESDDGVHKVDNKFASGISRNFIHTTGLVVRRRRPCNGGLHQPS